MHSAGRMAGRMAACEASQRRARRIIACSVRSGRGGSGRNRHCSAQVHLGKNSLHIFASAISGAVAADESFGKDEEITVEKIKNPLEELGYEVCWHHRDFVAGMTINDNMTLCIGASRMTVAVLSKAFERSKFCIDELQIANLKRKQTRKRCIVPVLVEKCKLPIDMEKFTYIPIEGKDFLRKLCRDLGKILAMHNQQY